MVEVRIANKGDVKAIVDTFAKAFYDDPVAIYYFPSDETREKDLKRFFGIQVRGLYLRRGECYIEEDGRGASLWAAPGVKLSGLIPAISLAPLIFTLRTRTPKALRALASLEKEHPHFPEHYYLATLGTLPESQGSGIGSRLIEEVLAKCDRDGIPAYLESSKEKNVPFYARFGFKVTKEVKLPYNGPSLWLMWRDAAVDTEMHYKD